MTEPVHPQPAGHSHLTLVESLRTRLLDTLRPLLAGASRVALIDFPNHPNVGDSAIWLGEINLLRDLGVASLCYTSDVGTFSVKDLARRIGDGTILIHGGGNLGDLWVNHQNLRERVIQSFPNNRIIQLAQSIHFGNPARLAQARQIFNAHPRLTLLLRDTPSLEFATREFTATCRLCPDMAFGIGPIPRPVEPDVESLWLSRVDKESAGTPAASTRDVAVVDWLEEAPSLTARINETLTRASWNNPRFASALHPLIERTFNRMAAERVARGCRLLSRGRRVITDRLHGHILCLLLGLPHELLPEKHGKIRNFYETWTQSCELGQFAGDHSQRAMPIS